VWWQQSIIGGDSSPAREMSPPPADTDTSYKEQYRSKFIVEIRIALAAL
jgi:hypothetical protein